MLVQNSIEENYDTCPIQFNFRFDLSIDLSLLINQLHYEIIRTHNTVYPDFIFDQSKSHPSTIDRFDTIVNSSSVFSDVTRTCYKILVNYKNMLQ